MKKQLLSFLCVLVSLMVAESAFAQVVHVRANIPFNFSLDKDTLPAGQYEIRAIDRAGSHVLAINNREGNMGRTFFTNLVSTSPVYSNKTKLVFKRYGEQYLLSQIWVAGTDTGCELPNSAREKELARGHAPAKVVVAADLR